MSLLIGHAAEKQAQQYLVSHGMTWVESNFRCRQGEIDLIMRDREMLVFVEVKHRTSMAFGSAIESVTRSKQQKLVKTALFYLLTKKLQDKIPIRFDVIGIEGKPPKITWIPNAFDGT